MKKTRCLFVVGSALAMALGIVVVNKGVTLTAVAQVAYFQNMVVNMGKVDAQGRNYIQIFKELNSKLGSSMEEAWKASGGTGKLIITTDLTGKGEKTEAWVQANIGNWNVEQLTAIPNSKNIVSNLKSLQSVDVLKQSVFRVVMDVGGNLGSALLDIEGKSYETLQEVVAALLKENNPNRNDSLGLSLQKALIDTHPDRKKTDSRLDLTIYINQEGKQGVKVK